MNLKKYGIFLLLASLAGCAHQAPFSTSSGHIGSAEDNQQKITPAGDIPKPVKKLAYVPPPKPKVKEPTYSVVVSDVPVRELLFSLARETKLNVDIHPSIDGYVSMNAIDQTLPAILDRISKQADIFYKVENNTIFISRDEPVLRTYQIDYVNMARKTTSDISVSAQVGATSGGAGGAGSSGSGQNKSATKVESEANNQFWDTLIQNIKDILAETDKEVIIGRSAHASTKEASQQNKTNASASGNGEASASAKEASGKGNQTNTGQAVSNQLASAEEESKNYKTLFAATVIANRETGVISVRATSRQHAKIQEFIDKVMKSAKRQVLIEATIVEVGLSDEFKAGVNWSKLAKDGSNQGLTFGFGKTNPTNLTTAGTSDDFVVNFIRTTSLGSLATSIKLLETFGTTKVLSSPKLMALNNQTSILKVVENLVYFSVEADTTTSTTGPSLTTFTTTAKTVPVGLVMSVTPQVGETGQITLMVRPTISRKVDEVLDPNPSIPAAIGNAVPVIQAREMESVLQMESGETAILGGLMQDDISKSTKAVPKASQLPLFGNLFKSKDDTVSKTELIIFLRATVVPDPSLESRELNAFKQYLPENQFPVAADEPVN